jgi:hypothetical protein
LQAARQKRPASGGGWDGGEKLFQTIKRGSQADKHEEPMIAYLRQELISGQLFLVQACQQTFKKATI